MPALSERTVVAVGGRELSLVNLDKVLYPATGTTKAQIIDYYARVAEVLLPHLRDRPVTLTRYPNGVDGQFFYEKNCPSHRPDWIRTVEVPTEGSGRWGRPSSGPGTIDFCIVDDLPTLIWLANLAALELHPYLHRTGAIDQPTVVVFDLDPGAPAGVLECAQVALRLRELFVQLDLESVVKTSGSKGLQVYVPVAPTPYGRTGTFAQAVAQLLEREAPDRITANMNKERRRGKVFVDWSQNNRHKTTVGAYSLRARERPTVSTPVSWDEVEEAVAADDPGRLEFTFDAVLDRVARHGDCFAAAAELEQSVPEL